MDRVGTGVALSVRKQQYFSATERMPYEFIDFQEENTSALQLQSL
jgi:hypothetical protein